MQAVVDAEPLTRYDTFEFTGDGREYFRIWIVNLVLSVVTLGVYSAWAKVRRSEYFYRHTRVLGATFDYYGRPLAILKGRAVAFVLFGGYYAATMVSPLVGLAAFAVLASILPWLVNRSLMFQLYNSSYRGLRFQFHGSTREAYWVMLGLPLVSLFSLFTLAPFWHQRLKHYQYGNAAFGRTRFAFNAPVGAFYKTYLIIGLCMVGLMAVLLFFAFMIAVAVALVSGGAESPMVAGFGVAIAMTLYVLGGLSLMSLSKAYLQNVVWRHTTLGPFRFSSTLEPHRLLLITLTNMLKVIVTLGLYRPFADINITRYVVGELTVVGVDNAEPFLGVEQQDVAALGDEAAEIFDFDLAF